MIQLIVHGTVYAPLTTIVLELLNKSSLLFPGIFTLKLTLCLQAQFYDEGAMLVQHYGNLSLQQLALPGTLIAHNAGLYDIDGCQTVLGDNHEESAATRSYQQEHLIEGVDQDLGDLSAAQSAANPTGKLCQILRVHKISC